MKPYGFWTEPDRNPPPGLQEQITEGKSECAKRGRHTDGWHTADPCYLMDNTFHTPACNWEQSFTSMNMQQGANVLKHLNYHGNATFACYVHKGASNRAYGVVCLVCGQHGHAYLGGARDCETVDNADDVFIPQIREQALLALKEAHAAVLVVDGQAGRWDCNMKLN